MPLRLEYLEDRLAPAVINWDGEGPTDNWAIATNWVGDILPGATDDVVVGPAFAGVNITSAGAVSINSVTSAATLTLTGGTFTIASTSQINNTLALHGGTLAGAGDLTINGVLNWDSTPTGSAGNITGTGTLTIAPGATINILGSGGRSLLNRTLDNQGTVNWSGSGGINVGNAALIRNRAGAVFAITNTGGMSNGGGPISTFANEGIVLKQTGTSSTSSNMAFNNSGVVDVQSGTFTLWGTGNSTGSWSVAAGATLNPTGTHTFTAGSNIGGLGAVNVTGFAVVDVDGIYTVKSTSINSGTMDFSGTEPINLDSLTFVSGTLTGSNNITITNKLDYTGGSMMMSGTGNTIIAPGAVVTHAGGGNPPSTGAISITTARSTGREPVPSPSAGMLSSPTSRALSGISPPPAVSISRLPGRCPCSTKAQSQKPVGQVRFRRV